MFYLSLILNVSAQNEPTDSPVADPSMAVPMPADFGDASPAGPLPADMAPAQAAPADSAPAEPAPVRPKRNRSELMQPELNQPAPAGPSPVESSVKAAPIEIRFISHKEREKLESLAIDGRIISTKWREGKELIYDCETLAFVCVNGLGKITCLEQAASAATYPEIYKSCVPLKSLDTLHLCTLEQVKMIDKAISSRAIGCK